MKSIIAFSHRRFLRALGVLVLALAVFFSVPAAADPENPGVPTIEVTGSAGISVPADTAQIRIGVVTEEISSVKAVDANAAMMRRLTDALKQAGLPEDDLVTASYNIGAQYDYSSYSDKRTLTGYRVSHVLRVTVRDLSRLGQVIDAAAAAGANECYGVSFFSSKTDEARDQALVSAVSEARRKAGLLAEAAGMKLGAVLGLSENGGSSYSVTYDMDMAAEAKGTQILSDDLNITASVTVTFEMLPE